MTLYDLNKAGYASLPSLTEKGWSDARDALLQYITTFKSDFYMLLNNDLHYYTIFTWQSRSYDWFSMVDAIIEIVRDLGNVKAIERNGPNVEIWIEQNGECNMYVLFDYERGVVTV